LAAPGAPGAGCCDAARESEEARRGEPLETAGAPSLNLPRVVAAAEAGSTVVAVVDARPPMLVSHDAGMTWRESGRGLPPGTAVAGSGANPDVVVDAARSPLFLSTNGGLVWNALVGELPDIDAVALTED